MSELDKASKYPYRIYLGFNDITKKLGTDPFSGPKQGYELFTCPDGVVIAGYDSALLDRGRKYGRLEPRGIFRGTLWGAATLPNAYSAAAGIFPANTVRTFQKP